MQLLTVAILTGNVIENSKVELAFVLWESYSFASSSVFTSLIATFVVGCPQCEPCVSSDGNVIENSKVELGELFGNKQCLKVSTVLVSFKVCKRTLKQWIGISLTYLKSPQLCVYPTQCLDFKCHTFYVFYFCMFNCFFR
jgi:hypothetical protein